VESHTPLSDASLEARRSLAALAARYHGAGWMLGTSGNLSLRYAPDLAVVTASGCDKGQLTEDDFVEVRLSGELVGGGPGRRPSAETSIHLAVYRGAAEATAVLHVHTVDSTLVARGEENPSLLDCTGLEMVKGWGIWDEGARAVLPVFQNHALVPRIAEDIALWLEKDRSVPALIIENHGLTAWGSDLESAHRHVEITEFLCRVHRGAAEEAGGP
jgi:methylthioribulose-1-phosphate dehydratase